MNSKAKIIKASEELFWQMGYKNTSIADILQKSQVNKGSFFHFFPNKITLFLEVIDYFYLQEILPLLNKNFQNNKDPQQQILNFCEDINNTYQKNDFKGGCLLGNMALELSDINDIFRKKIENIFKKWQEEMLTVLRKINSKVAPEKIADYIIWGLQGVTLTAKVHKTKTKNKVEFQTFKDVLQTLMQPK
jgi:TetR/AcrR family transcriptional regulator, transcriptional repressor for nem operon